MGEELSIDSEFSELGWPLSDEERRNLTENLKTHGCRDPILVWANHDNVILDGHNRYSICQAEEIGYKVKAVRLETRQDCIDFICNLQLSRRNSSEEHKSYLRGKRYNAEKSEQGGDKKSKYHRDTLIDTAEKIAVETGVSTATVKRDAKFADSVDALAKPVKDAVLTGQLDATRAEVKALAELPKAEQRVIAAKVKSGAADSVKEAIADAEPAKAKVVKDREGSEVPPHLHAVAGSKWRAEAVKLLNKLVEETKKNALPPGGMWTDVAEAIAGLHQARNILVNSQFYCLCPSCGGAKKGCEDCRKSGWFPRWRLDEFNNQKAKR